MWKSLILDILKKVMDPELPAINIVELGIVRDVDFCDNKVNISITPTYSGCPAIQMIEDDIRKAFQEEGIMDVSVKTVLFPAWTTDWMSEETKVKLRREGIAPPEGSVGEGELVMIGRAREKIPCPYCQSLKTIEKSEFGSTACKAIHFCNSCSQPFDYFKAF